MKRSLLFTVFFNLLVIGSIFSQADVLANAWEDLNGNGIRDGGEPGLNGIPISLFDSGNAQVGATQNTTGAGEVTFLNVPDGTGYYIVFGDGGYKVTTADVGGGNTQGTDVDTDSDAIPPALESHTFDIAGVNIDGIGIGLFTAVEINGNVWLDLNANGQDEGDGPIPQAVDVTLLDDMGNLVTTDADGNALTNPINTTDAYSFTNLFPGTYTIQFEEPGGSHPTGLHLTLQDVGSDATDSDADRNTGETVSVTLDSGDPPVNDVDAGYFVVAQVGDFVWEDLNGNGIQDGEPGLAGVQVTLEFAAGGAALDPDGNPIAPQTSGGAGDYLFDEVPPGDYIVIFETPFAPYFLTEPDQTGDAADSDADLNTGQTPSFTLQSGDSNTDLDAGYYQKCTVGDFTWEDLNGNGNQDGEPGLDGVNISITDDVTGAAPLFEVDGVTAYNPNTTSGGGGAYIFDNLPPGTYFVTFTAPGGFFFTQQGGDSDADPTTGITVAVTCASGESVDLDAGFLQPGEIAGFAFHDRDANGLFDGSDILLDGITFTLTNLNGPTNDITGAPVGPITTAGGTYRFTNLPPGDYTIEAMAAGWIFTTPNASGDAGDNPDASDDSDFDAGGRLINDITLEGGDAVEDRAAGLYMLMTIGGTIWGEEDTSCSIDASESGQNMVVVNLIDDEGNVVGTATSDAMGNYQFAGIQPGTYVVELAGQNFAAGGNLYGLQSCGCSGGDDDVDGDDNGDGPLEGPIVSTDIELLCGLEVGPTGNENFTIDFCFYADCRNQNPLTAPSCATVTDTLCDINDLQIFCSSMPSPPLVDPAPAPLCNGAGFPHNMSWFAFVAGSGNYSIDINVFGCVGGDGSAQIGIKEIENCDFGSAIDIFCQAQGVTGTVSISSGLLEPGNTYFLWLDGSTGAVCSYDISINGNFMQYQVPDPTDVLCTNLNANSGGQCDTICPGTMMEFEAREDYDDLNAKFTWTITKPDGTKEIVVTTGPDSRYLQYTFPDLGNYEVELTDIYVKCSELPIAKIVIPVVVANPPDEDFGIHELCESLLDPNIDGPWDGPTVVWETAISDPNNDGYDGWFGSETYDQGDDGGTFTYNVTTADGCFHQQSVGIIMLLNSPEVFIDTILCGGDVLEVGPYTIDDFPTLGLQLPVFPNGVGCDSTVTVTAYDIQLTGNIIGDCSNGGYQLTYVQQDNPLINEFLVYEYIWTNITEGTIVDDDDPDNDPTTVIITQSGEYEVMVIVSTESGEITCQIPIGPVAFDIEDLAPEMVTEDGNWGTEFCDGASAAFTYEINFTEDPQNVINYLWTYPNGVTVIGPDDSTSINLNWAGTNGGPICMSIQTQCGTSPPLCDTVVITPIPSATLPVLPIICVDSLTTISSQGTSLPTYVYNWDFDGGSPVGTGAGPYNVSWGSEGIKEIELVIDNLSCLSQPVTTNIQVVAPEAPPLISCTTPGIGAVNFFWDDVDNNLGYNVQVISGQAGGGNQTDTLINFSGLGEGDTVEILLTTLTNSPCGNLTSTLFCVSQNCVPPQVDIDQVNPICITSGSQPIQLNAQINPPSNGTYIYSGNPAVSSTGLFDPLLAAEGVNTVRLEYIDPDNCRQFTTTQITVNITPTADFTSNDNLICQDSTVEIQYSGNITNGGNFDWEFGPGVITPGNGSGPFDIQWNSPGQKTIELTVTKNGCISETETFNIVVEPRVPQVEIRCDDEQATSITVAWDEVVNTTDYTLIVDGVPFNTNDLTYTITGLTPDSDHTFEIIANSNNSCPGTTMNITCNANACPPITIDFSIGDTTICLNSNAAPFQIQALISGGLGTGNGTVTWSGSGIDPVTGIFDPTAAGISNPQGHLITALFEEETCDQSENIRIKVISQPVSTFTGIDAICIADEYNVIYTGTGGLPLDWQEPNGVTVTPNGVGRYKVTFPNPGTYTFGLVTGVVGCLSELTEKTVEVQEELDEITIDCSTTLTSVEFTWNDIDCVTDYEITIDGVDEGIQSDLSYLLTGLPEGQTVDIIVTPISDCECPAISVAANCTARACPPVVLALTSAQNNFCEGDVTTPFQLNAGVTGSDGSGTGVWTGTGVNAQGQFNPAGLAPGSYTLNYEFGEANCSFDDDITITILGNPTVTVAATNPDCFLENVGSAIPTTSGGNGNYTYRLDGNTVTLNDLNTINPGSHILVVNDGNNCDASASFSIIAAQPATISVSGQSLIILGESVQLNTTIGNIASNLIDSIVWTNSAGQVLCSGANCNAITITPEFDDTYCATLYYNDGCNVEDCFDVELKKIIEIILPNIIRPGNPTNNSFFIEQYDNIKKVNSMSIFDRWGNLVFTQKDFLPGSSVAWDGKLDNRDIVPGVYAYTIDLILTDDEPLLINGDVTVIR